MEGVVGFTDAFNGEDNFSGAGAAAGVLGVRDTESQGDAAGIEEGELAGDFRLEREAESVAVEGE